MFSFAFTQSVGLFLVLNIHELKYFLFPHIKTLSKNIFSKTLIKEFNIVSNKYLNK